MSEHSWAKYARESWIVCTVCGAVRNHDRPDSQCRGAAKIAIRSEPATKPCDLECGTCRYQLDPTHCADVVSGVLPQREAGSDELEIVRLRRELGEALAKIELFDDHRRADGELISRQGDRGELDRLRAENERLRCALESITSEFERAVRAADHPRGGQHVQAGGDFVAALRLPSFVARARWWARELRAALESQS